MSSSKTERRLRRHQRIRSRLIGTAARPRLHVFRSNMAIYAQLIDDATGKVIAASSSLKMKERGIEAAKKVGADISAKAKAAQVGACVFDRGGYLYHGRVKALAEAAREGGLQF